MQNRAKKIAALVGICLWMLLSVGCWNRTELNEWSIVLGTALDMAVEEEKYMVTTEIANPTQLLSPIVGGGGGDEPSTWILTSTGWTQFDAVRNFTHQALDKLLFSHNQVIVVGEELAREGLAPVLDFYIRDHEMRRLSNLVIAKDTTGREIISIEQLKGVPTSIAINQLIESSWANSAAVRINISEFISAVNNGATGIVVGRIELIDPGQPEGLREQQQEGDAIEVSAGGGGGGSQEEEDMLDMKQDLHDGELLRYSGAAVFKEDRLVGWLDRKEARGYNWVMGEMDSTIIVATSPEKGKPRISIEVVEVGSRVQTQFIGNKPVVKVTVDVEGNLGEHMGNRTLSVDQGLLHQLESRMAQVVRNDIEAALAKAQELETDFFNFSGAFNRQHHQQWSKIREDWNEMFFPNLEVEIEVLANIRRIGLTRMPVQVGE